jgi:2C-methyl-D-erythritol 2,4-cyclodiphosphate synthase
MDQEIRFQKIEERVSDIRATLTALEWQLKTLIIWQNQQIDPWKTDVTTQLAELVKADEIAEAVSAKINKRHNLQLTFVQKSIASAVGLLTIADFIMQVKG